MRKRITVVGAAAIVLVTAALLWLNRQETALVSEPEDVIEAARGTNGAEERTDERQGSEVVEPEAAEAAEPPEPSKPLETPEPSVQEDIPSLAEAYADDFPIGAAVEPSHTSGLKAELLKKHVNLLVAENAMKPDAMQPTEGKFQWERADRLVEFAKANGMELRFHTLVWHSQVGAWFFKDAEGKPMVEETDPDKREANKRLLLERLDTHVRTIVARYKDDIRSWDVVNEVIEPADPDGMRASDWYKIAGTDFIETAFRAAREAGGPEIKLYINDYGTDSPAKRDRLYGLVKEMLDKGVPIDGVGHQTHISVHGPTVASIIDSMKLFGDLGLDNLVTELDMSLYAWNDRGNFGDAVPDYIIQRQAERYGELFEAFRANKEIIGGVVFWGISDDHSWLNDFPVQNRTDAPLLFDRQLHAKPAFWAVVDSAAGAEASSQ
ncbi:endo-1,4-beta-xylanase [Paenibacillus sp. TRM 82003]|nr:endo-1,4-beta-xylanase [Paenibacillus sp. TRM 82003]